MSPRILITMGGTSEPIDQVRKITNTSTGRLGCLIADGFTAAGASVTTICGQHSLLPTLPVLQHYVIENVQELYTLLEKLMTTQHYDAIVHCMAVSDYRLDYLCPMEESVMAVYHAITTLGDTPTSTDLQQAIAYALTSHSTSTPLKKVSSRAEHMMMVLKKNPKLITQLKQWQPLALLVGFKLLVDVSEETLMSTADLLLKENNCDYVLANDLKQIHGDEHTGHLLGSDGSVVTFHTKQAIASGIVHTILKAIAS